LTSIIEKRFSLHKNLANQLCQNDSLKSQIVQLQALANIGTVTCMIAHEINNILTPLTSYADLALKNPEDKPLIEKALQRTTQNCRRASKIMESMLSLANGEMQEKQATPLLMLVEEIFTCLCRDFVKDGITVNIQIPSDVTIWAVPVQIQQVLMNLILNARDAMLHRGGILTIKAQQSADDTQIEIADTGDGIETENLGKIFDTFFTTKTDNKLPSQHCGAGLGLAFCKKVIDSHKGSITVESEPARGTIFKVTLPKS
jgi:signal transduction histidine kinase